MALPATPAILPSSPAFTSFPLLPPEIRLHIWSYTLHLAFVNIRWHPTQRTFKSPRKPPSLLHVNRESRAYGLKHYNLSFSSSPEFARVYFSFDIDVLNIDWPSLGPSPGRLGRKISEVEMGKVQDLMIDEVFLIKHAKEEMRELMKFTALKSITVICDKSRPEGGNEYGAEEMEEFWEDIRPGKDVRPGGERWPSLMCLRDWDEEEECSRHWWFDWWNQSARYWQEKKWPGAMSECLRMTLFENIDHLYEYDFEDFDDSEDSEDEEHTMGIFFLSILLAGEVASP
jgi:hypothetical protein